MTPRSSMKNSEPLSGLKLLFTIQYIVQWVNIYGTHTRMWRWSKIIFAIYSIQIFPIFLSSEEQLVLWPKRTKYPVVECIIFGTIALALIPLSNAFSSFFAIFVQVFTIFMYALSLHCPQLDDLLLCASTLRLSLAESSLLLTLLWSAFSTFFFSLFPLLTHPDELLLELPPCYLHLAFTFSTNLLWTGVLLYTHHRTQIAVDARKCGVWERVVPAPDPPQQKCPTWRHGHKYSQGALVTHQGSLFRLLSPSSTYPHPPSSSQQVLFSRSVLFPVLSKETGPLHQSRVLSLLLTLALANICVMLATMPLLSAQHQPGCLLLAATNCYLVYRSRKNYCIDSLGDRGSGPPPRDLYVYDPHGVPVPPQQTPPENLDNSASLSSQTGIAKIK